MPSNFFANYFNKKQQQQQEQHHHHHHQPSIPSPEVVNSVPVSNPTVSNLIREERPKHLYHKSSDNLAIGL